MKHEKTSKASRQAKSAPQKGATVQMKAAPQAASVKQASTGKSSGPKR